jgi:hypothetical protein
MGAQLYKYIKSDPPRQTHPVKPTVFAGALITEAFILKFPLQAEIQMDFDQVLTMTDRPVNLIRSPASLCRLFLSA